LDMITIMVASVSMGISVDCAIHYLCRFREELPRCGDYMEAMRRSHLTSGKAIFHTSLAVILGFCTLILSNFLPTVYFGVLTALAMASALFSCLSLVPIALLRIRPLPVVDSPKPGAGTGG
ncbi:MAG: MMPL family transporter, partial [Planctomycetota bacterium]